MNKLGGYISQYMLISYVDISQLISNKTWHSNGKDPLSRTSLKTGML